MQLKVFLSTAVNIFVSTVRPVFVNIMETTVKYSGISRAIKLMLKHKSLVV